MKVCIYSDPHWCENSSIIRSKGLKYSTRLENLIESMNWVEQLAWSTGCECIICCGDFFDASVLNSQEISALQEIRWTPLSHLFLTGNHEASVSSLEYSTSDLFKLCPDACVINTPQQYFIEGTTVEFCFLPYVLERDRKTIAEYFGPQTCKRIIFSHNDIKDVQYGSFLSTEGFEVSDIEQNCDLYFNGHIHHCCNVTNKIFNVGNLTGQNFTEDATKYAHCAVVLDTETLEYKLYQNGYAFKFYKLDGTYCRTEEEIQHVLNQINYNGVVTLQVNEDLEQYTRQQLDILKKDHIQEYRLLVKRTIVTDVEQTNFLAESSADHIKQFENYVLSAFENNELLLDELKHVLRG